MVNAWSLLYDELNGTMDENFPVKNTEPDDNIVISTGSTASATFVNSDTIDFSTVELPDGMSVNYDMDPDLSYMEPGTVLSSTQYNDTLNIKVPGIEDSSTRKYEEDKSIKALQDYISTTYNGHYTSKENNVQTLDLIESVGDAESFCRSNAIKYLSRYDKKGQAKRDILKALHYTLLLYHFSGQLNETPTRGYETF